MSMIHRWLIRDIPTYLTVEDAMKKERDEFLEILEDIPIDMGPYLTSYREHSSNTEIRRHIELNMELARDWENHLSTPPFGTMDTLRASNLFLPDLLIDRFVSIASLAFYLRNGYLADEVAEVECDGMGKHPKFIRLPKILADHYFAVDGRIEKPQVITTDSPFFYVIPRKIFGEDFGPVIDCIDRFYQGETGGLSRNTMTELGRLSCIILTPTQHFSALRVASREDSGILVTGVDIPGFYEPVDQILIGGDLTHEAKHFQDWRYLDGCGANAFLFELRALTAEYLYYDRLNSREGTNQINGFLEPYVRVLGGGTDYLPMVAAYRTQRDFAAGQIESLPRNLLSDLNESVGRVWIQ